VRALPSVLLAAGAAASAFRGVRSVQRLRRVERIRPVPPPGEVGPPVVAVVPARNEEAVIDDCVRGLRAQTAGERPGADLRIVVVDDASTDATGAIVAEHAAQDPRVTAVRTDGPPPGWKG
jgi:cellulose synthase/poly-beta-1,6-N-acetylglucosamine synthase-like glycosyltransferase